MPSPDDAAPASPNSPPPGSDPLPDLLAECIEAVDRHGPAAVEAILARVPQHAPALRRALGQLDLVGLLPERQSQSGVREVEEPVPERLGEFRLHRRLGGGGMGVVYLAEQTSLGRQVAIKLVRPDQLYFGGARARFRREVEIVARLQDPGIVPIHTVGNEGGIPFFAMEYIAGGSLADVLLALAPRRHEQLTGRDLAAVVATRAGQPPPQPLPELFAGTWAECVCRIVEAMAHAVQHAHERGVVHRDLKPSNALLTPGGRVLLCDFGLATDGTSPLTQAGQQVGTVAYMAPEQVRGEPVDVRTDVYGLGVTLYELLMRSPAFAATSGEELRQRILSGSPATPDLQRDVPRDARIVCQKAMAVEPRQRYQSAQALAADLANFLASRPVTARSAGPLLRLWRWQKRHPAAAVAIASGVVTAAVTLLLWANVQDLSAVARRNLEQTLSVLKNQIERAHSAELGDIPGLDAVRTEEVTKAVSTLQRLRDENPADRTVRTMFVEGLMLACDIDLEVNRPEVVDDLLRLAGEEIERLRRDGATPTIDMLLGRVHLHRGNLAKWLGDAARSEQELSDAAATFERLLAAPTPGLDVVQSKRLLGDALANRGTWRVLRGDLDAGEVDLRRSQALDAEPGVAAAENRSPSGAVRRTFGILALQRGKPAEARTIFEGLVSELKAQAAAAPQRPELTRQLAHVKAVLGITLGRLREAAAAAQVTGEGVALMDPLVAAFPARHVYAWERNLFAYQQAQLQHTVGDLPAAIRTLRAAVVDQERLVAANPERVDFRHDFARMKGSLGAMIGQTEDEAEVGPLLSASVALQEQVVAARPQHAASIAQLANLRSNLALHRLHTDDVAGAATAIDQAVAAFEQLLQRGETLPVMENQFPFTMQLAAQIRVVMDDAAGAVRHLARLQAVSPLPRAALEAFGKQLSLADRADFRALMAGTK